VLFRTSPRIFFGWRNMLLRLFGARIGPNARISPTVRIWAPWNLSVGQDASVAYDADLYCVAPIEIGDYATVSQYAHLCAATHDITDPHMRLVSAPIRIESQAWVCAGAFVGPGCTIHEGAVVGARAVVTRDVSEWTVVAGNPAMFVKRRVLNTKTNTNTDASTDADNRPQPQPNAQLAAAGASPGVSSGASPR
jgi:putative colanic acid biosynthesis acetyltransferase WcaF